MNIVTKPWPAVALPELLSRGWTAAVVLACMAVSACGPSSTMFHSQIGEPMVIQQSAYSAEGCRRNLAEEAQRIGMPLRSTDVKGSIFGDTLLWPFIKGYVCIGTDQAVPPGIIGQPYLYQG